MPAFRVFGKATTAIPSGTTLNVGNVNLDYNQTNSYDTTTGIFTAPQAGLYHIFVNARVGTTNGLSQLTALKNNANTLALWEIITNNQSAQSFGVGTVAYLSRNDTVRAKVTAGSISFDANCSWGAAKIG
jgi:hypothetical protein